MKFSIISSIIKKNKIKIIIGCILFIALCFTFFLIYKYQHPKINICTLKQNYNNYSNIINVQIIRNEASISESFKSDSKELLGYRKQELINAGYKVIERENKLTSIKTITEDNLLEKYEKSGYTCNDNNNKINIKFELKSDINNIEVKSSYSNEVILAKVNNKDYLKKVIIADNIDSNELGTYIVSYKLPITKYRNETIYEIVEVKDTTAPSIILKGSENIILNKGDKYQELGYEVEDNYDEKKNIKVEISGNVDTSKTGEYKITYTAIDISGNKTSVIRKVTVRDNPFTYINGILIVNKKYSLPSDYNPGLQKVAKDAYDRLAGDAKNNGYDIPLVSGFRSYETQKTIYNNYVSIYGEKETDTFSAKPGHSEHQTGLAMDVGKIDDDYGDTREGIWLKENAHKYGFIIRYPKGKESITGYKYEPWHIRYLGEDLATKVYKSGLSLEEYLGIA
ncbi:MAG: D-alanyl-D-alanine carboxypeptidase family protein [Bacilli bacterium]